MSMFTEWLNWDAKELQRRHNELIGKTVRGKISPKRGNRYYVKWNGEPNDTVVINSDTTEDCLGGIPTIGMWVTCTIVGLGPSHVQWDKQHPYAMEIESCDTRESHQ